jgi:hypothetical protein
MAHRIASALAVMLCACSSAETGPLAEQLGTGNGSPESVTLTLMLEPEEVLDATDVAFNPANPDELWVVHRRHPPHVPCFEADPNPDCLLVEGSVAVLFDGTAPGSAWARFKDANAWHFMRLPPGIAFGPDQTFATCGEARTGNFDDGVYDFIGPTLFSSSLDLFGVEPWNEEMNGTHLDMLHASPFCVGIAHERDRVYWVFNGKEGSLDRYDFNDDHGPGADDHSDGEIWHYAPGVVTRVPGVPSHMEYHRGKLYVADTGGGRIIALDPSRARVLEDYEPNYDLIPTHVTMTGAEVAEIVAPGLLEQPSGLAISGDVLFVSDYATSRLHAFTLDGEPIRSLDTGMPPETLTGITIGPDDKLYFADHNAGRAYRVDPQEIN